MPDEGPLPHLWQHLDQCVTEEHKLMLQSELLPLLRQLGAHLETTFLTRVSSPWLLLSNLSWIPLVKLLSFLVYALLRLSLATQQSSKKNPATP
jgi:hypothetical protein